MFITILHTSVLLASSFLFSCQSQPAAQTTEPPSSQEPYSLLQAQPSPQMRITKDIKYAHRRLTRDALTSLDIYEPGTNSTGPRPTLIYIHGGGWAIGDKARVHHKATWATYHGWNFVSINYRLSPRVQHPDHAIDAAAAIAYVIEHATEHNTDPTKLVIMGHSAGAHLAAIVATDESLLAKHNLAPSDLSGVVLLDGAGYDIPTQMNSPLLTGRTRTMYENAFGDDPKLWITASPTLQAKPGDDLPPLLAIHVGDRQRSRVESTNLVTAWQATPAKALIHHAPDKDHASINKDLGTKNDPDTRVVTEFIYSAFGLD